MNGKFTFPAQVVMSQCKFIPVIGSTLICRENVKIETCVNSCILAQVGQNLDVTFVTFATVECTVK